MPRPRGPARLSPCALALLAASLLLAASARSFADVEYQLAAMPVEAPVGPEPIDGILPPLAPSESAKGTPDQELTPDQTNGEVVTIDPSLTEEITPALYPDWSWRWLPVGLIYHSYMAGVHEPRMALVAMNNLDDRNLWDATLGGRVGMLQYGNGDPVNPVGYQLDFYGAAIPRLDVDHQQDVDSTDYVFGLPLTWGDSRQQWKFGYSHLSSHLGDEYAISHPGSLFNRVNYVRDALVLGTSHYATPAWRLYGEVGWAFHASGGAGRVTGQFGTEYSEPGPTSRFVPFVAANARVRDDDSEFTGDVTLQAGWLRRNIIGNTLRFGGQYYNGKSSQSQFYRLDEQQLGVGIWYDF